MEQSSPLFHPNPPSLLHQCLSFSDLMSIGVYASKSPEIMKKMPTPSTQSNMMKKATCKRRRKQKKNNGDEEKKKKTIDSKEGGQIGYIHVRARRGEATDSHSLAERVRREKISEKMKTLQSIVPGCDKVSGMAVMLDEVINYVQSLQNEIQILSLKLANVNPMYDYGTEHEECMPRPYDQNMTTIQQQMISSQEHQIPCRISQNNGETLWDLGQQREELDDDLFAIIKCSSCY